MTLNTLNIGGIAVSSDETVAGQTWSDAAGQVPRHRLADVLNAPGTQVERIARCGECATPVGEKAFGLHCASCGQILVRDSDLTEPARPDALVPFTIDEDAARAAFREWIEHRWFAPKSFKGAARIRALDGVYLPFWSFSASTHSAYAGRRGIRKSRQVSRTRTNGNGQPEQYWETEHYTQWHDAFGEVGRTFQDVTVPACSPLPQKIPSWPLDDLRPYTRGATSGRRIIAYDVTPEDGFTQATARMAEQIEDDVRRDIGGNQQRVNEVSTQYADESCSLLLLPAWLISYAHGTRTWSVLVNGADGQVSGDRPYSSVKIALLIGVLSAAMLAILLLARR